MLNTLTDIPITLSLTDYSATLLKSLSHGSSATLTYEWAISSLIRIVIIQARDHTSKQNWPPLWTRKTCPNGNHNNNNTSDNNTTNTNNTRLDWESLVKVWWLCSDFLACTNSKLLSLWKDLFLYFADCALGTSQKQTVLRERSSTSSMVLNARAWPPNSYNNKQQNNTKNNKLNNNNNDNWKTMPRARIYPKSIFTPRKCFWSSFAHRLRILTRATQIENLVILCSDGDLSQCPCIGNHPRCASTAHGLLSTWVWNTHLHLGQDGATFALLEIVNAKIVQQQRVPVTREIIVS